MININNKTNREPFEPHDLRLLEAIAAHASVALGNARKYEDTLRLSQIDALTGLANHGYFYKTLDREIERSRRYERGLSLVMLDIDYFKQYNDRHGHRAGDQALVAVARIIGDRSRAHDIVARYGGEEFSVLCRDSLEADALVLAERLRAAVAASEFLWDGKVIPVTVSIGAAGRSDRRSAPSEVITFADRALYSAKKAGRNTVKVSNGRR